MFAATKSEVGERCSRKKINSRLWRFGVLHPYHTETASPHRMLVDLRSISIVAKSMHRSISIVERSVYAPRLVSAGNDRQVSL